MKISRSAKKISAAMLASIAVSVPAGCLGGLETSAASSNAEMVVQYAKTKTYITSRPNEVTSFYNLVCDWCSMFVYYCAYQTGVSGAVPNATFCDSQYGVKGGVEFFKEWGEWQYSQSNGGSYIPVRGDVIYFDWTMDGYADHVGYVDYVSNGYVHTVEGNAGTYGDCVKLNAFPLDYKNILGYGTPDYGDAKPAAAATAANKGTAVATPMVNVSGEDKPADSGLSVPAKLRVSSPIGAWLRADSSSSGRKIGILSTDQIVEADKICGNWVHIVDTTVEDCDSVFSGWTAVTNLADDVEEEAVAVEIAPVTRPAIIIASDPEIPEEPAPEPEVEVPVSEYSVYRVSSEIGAWFRSSPKFENSNKLALLDTDAQVFVYEVDDEWAYGMISENGGNSYKFGYIHLSTISAQESEDTAGSDVIAVYKVTSPIGCRLRMEPKFEDDNTIMILDTDDTIDVLSIAGEWVYTRIISDNGACIYGYVHTSTIDKI